MTTTGTGASAGTSIGNRSTATTTIGTLESAGKHRKSKRDDDDDRDDTDWHVGKRWDWKEWLARHEEKRGGCKDDDDDDHNGGHCKRGHRR